MTQRDAVFPTGRHDLYTSYTYSAAIRSGDLLFMPGQVGSCANREATLQAGGCELDDIVA
jgi:enamine deaminase RidA (YjgF/YER057c/UK114 family)